MIFKSNAPDIAPEGLVVAVQRDAVAAFGLAANPSISIKRTIANPYSKVYIFEVSQRTFRQRIYVKVPHSKAQGNPILQARLSSEFEILKRLRTEDSSTCGHSVAVPFAYYPKYPAIATLEAATDTLRMHYRTQTRVFFPSLSRKVLTQEVTQCGLWLRRFQEITAAETAPFDVLELLTYVKLRLDRLIKINNIDFSPTLAERIIDAIHRVGSGIQSNQIRIVGRHNDFASHNILARKGKIWIIDFSMFDYGSSAYDPCNYWLELELLKLNPTYSTHFLNTLQERFLDAYGLISPDSPAFTLARCKYTLNRILTLLDRTTTWSPSSFHKRQVAQACLNWLESFSYEG